MLCCSLCLREHANLLLLPCLRGNPLPYIARHAIILPPSHTARICRASAEQPTEPTWRLPQTRRSPAHGPCIIAWSVPLARLPLSLSGGLPLHLPQARCECQSASLALRLCSTHAPRREHPLNSHHHPPLTSTDHPTHAHNPRRLHAPLTPPSLSPLTPSSLSHNLSAPTLRPPRQARPRKPRPHTLSSVYAQTPRTFTPLRRRDAPSSIPIGLHCFAVVAEPLLTAKQAFLCHHHHPPVETLAPLRTPVRCRPFQPSGAIQQPSRHATQARRRIRHLNLSPPTTTSNADVIA